MHLTIKNYRSYSTSHPLKIQIEDGVTAIVGPNNSGKSYILRSFYEFRNLFREIGLNQFAHIGDPFNLNVPRISHTSEIFHKYNKDNIELVLEVNKAKLVSTVEKVGSLRTISKFYINDRSVSRENINHNELTGDFGGEKEELIALRNSLATLEHSIYFPSFRNTINIGAEANYYDIDIGEAFIKSYRSFSTSPDSDVIKKSIQVENDLQQLFGYNKFRVDSVPEQKKFIVNIDGEPYSLSDLGSGITQFILVFASAAIKKPSFILIDEPELNLHPKLQIDFINRLLKYAKNGIIFATHNLGLAHSVADRIYSVTKINNKESIITPFEETPNFTEFLGELNFANFLSLDVKKLLLVEGPNEVKVFSIFLEKMKKSQDIIIWPLRGNNLINNTREEELKQLTKLGTKIKICGWIDKETEPKTTERRKFIEVCKKLGFEIFLSAKRATENYFPDAAVKLIYPALSQLGPNDDRPHGWCKNKNWQVAQVTKIEDLKGTDLYAFLNKI